jgi:hypothetical protein
MIGDEQLIDLLSFNRPSIRELAKVKIAERENLNSISDVLNILSSGVNTLSRPQVLTLIGALRTSGKGQLLLVNSWLRTKPSPLVVAHLLIARDGRDSSDGFNLEAARYLLQSKETKLPKDMLITLTTHSEPMARAYSYSMLDRSNPEDRRILEAARITETNPRLKKQLPITTN